MKYLFCLCVLVALVMPLHLYAQQRTVTGTIREISSDPLPKATVTEKGVPANSVASDESGHFTIRLRGRSYVIIVRYVGYQPLEVNVRDQGKVDIVLQSDVGNLDETIVVGYSKKKQLTNTGAISTIKADAIREVPTSSVQNALAGRLPGFYTQQRSGQPGRDGADYFIRGVSSLNPTGNKPLIIVDDIEYTYEQLSQINVNEIESISILKDASTTAVFGIKGANGVLVVTTRRGVLGKPRFNFRIEGGGQSPVRTPKFLNSYQTAQLVNEAYANDGLPALFTQQDLDLFKNGTDPYGHPDVNWYKAIMRNTSYEGNMNLDISGGTQAVKYFISGGGFTQNGGVKNFSTNADGVNSNYFYKRYNVRSNLDIQVTRNLSMRFDVSARFMDINQPYGMDVVSSLYNFASIHPYSAPFLNPNGSYAYAYDTKDQMPTINAQLQTKGYSRNRRSDYNLLYGFKQRLDAITEGLYVTGQVAYGAVQQNTLNLLRGNPPSYHFDPRDSSYHLNTGVNGGGYTYGTYRTIGNTDIDNQRLNVQLFLNYERTFHSHHIQSFFLWNQQSTREDDNASVPQKFKGYSTKLSYDFRQKYLVDFTAAYNGSDRFAGSKRFGFFPALSAGWNLAQEDFIKRALPVFKQLKLRGSYGVLGSDATVGDQYLYTQVYKQGATGYSFGETNQGGNTIYEGDLGNNNVTWEKVKKLNIGLDATLLNSKLNITAEYFHDFRYDQLVTRQDIPVILGIGLPRTNVGKTVNRGFEIDINYHNNIGQFTYTIAANFSYSKNKIIYQAEAAPRFPWLATTGQAINQPFGYTFTGFYSQEDVDNPKVAKPTTAIPIQAGDLKYKDLNGDGIIDQNDISPIGKPNLQTITFGMPIGFSYKGFSVNVLFQGATGYGLGLQGNAIEPFQGQFQPIHETRWTPATAASAQFPRLTSNPTTINSPASYLSDFWLINAHYIRLKTLDAGYQLPNRLLPFKINNARIYVSAYNLFTWSNVSKKYQQDPEVASLSAGDAYLNQRVLNLGLQIGF